MPITCGWYGSSEDIIEVQFQGKWTWDDFEQAMREAYALTSCAPHRVDRIINFLGSGPIPSGALEHVIAILKDAPPNWGCTVVVQNSPFVQLLYESFIRLQPQYKTRYFMAHSVAEAEAIVAQQRGKNS